MAGTARLYEIEVTAGSTARLYEIEVVIPGVVPSPAPKTRVHEIEVLWSAAGPLARLYEIEASTGNITASTRLYEIEAIFNGTTPDPLRTGAYRLDSAGQWVPVGFMPL